MATAAAADAPIASGMARKLQEALSPSVLDIENQSAAHSGHYKRDGSAASTSGETHFKVTVVSDKFAGMPLVKRHQLIYSLLQDEFKQGLHALSLVTKTAAEVKP